MRQIEAEPGLGPVDLLDKAELGGRGRDVRPGMVVHGYLETQVTGAPANLPNLRREFLERRALPACRDEEYDLRPEDRRHLASRADKRGRRRVRSHADENARNREAGRLESIDKIAPACEVAHCRELRGMQLKALEPGGGKLYGNVGNLVGATELSANAERRQPRAVGQVNAFPVVRTIVRCLYD